MEGRFKGRDTGNLLLHISGVHCHIMVKQTEQGAYINLDPDRTKGILESVGDEVEKMEELGKNPIIITSPIVRMYFKKITEEQFRDLIVVSYNEIENDVELQSIGMVTV